MPTELALLPFIESAFNPEAMSSARASGMWQFIPSTGRIFDLKQNVFRDDRRDVLASTRAALDYLQKLHGMFGDWHLALAAYNWGEGSVPARNREATAAPASRPTTRACSMPSETRYYVPKLQAVKNIVARPEAFGLTLPPLANHPYFLSRRDRARHRRRPGRRDSPACRSTSSSALNPQMNRPVILAAGTPQVLLPYDNANQFVRHLPLHTGPLASWTAWVAPKTLQPAEAAKQVGMSEAELREVNRIPPHMLVKAGSTLLVPRGEHPQADVSEHIADNAMIALAPDGPGSLRKVALKAGRGDTVAAVARRYRVSASQVALWNGVGAASPVQSWPDDRRLRRARRAKAKAPSCSGPQGARTTARRRRSAAPSQPRRGRRSRPASSRQATDPPPTRRRIGRPSQRRSTQRVGDRAQVDVFEFAADRHAARQPRDLQARAPAAPRPAHARWLRPRR